MERTLHTFGAYRAGCGNGGSSPKLTGHIPRHHNKTLYPTRNV